MGKTGRTYYDDELMAQVRDKIERDDRAKGRWPPRRDAAAPWIAMSDRELWDFVPPPGQLRALNVSFGVGCRSAVRSSAAADITRGSPDPGQPFLVKCPVGGETYPGNDFQPWNPNSITDEPERGPGYVDHGAGWVDEKGRRYFFVGYYVFWQRWQREISGAISSLRQAYLLTDEPIYAHKCAVLLARIAGIIRTSTTARRPITTGGLRDQRAHGRYIWMNGWISNLSTAYDAIYPALAAGEDTELTEFLAAQGVDDPRRLIEQKMLAAMAGDIFAKFIWGNTDDHPWLPSPSCSTMMIKLCAHHRTHARVVDDWEGDVEPAVERLLP